MDLLDSIKENKDADRVLADSTIDQGDYVLVDGSDGLLEHLRILAVDAHANRELKACWDCDLVSVGR